MSADIRTHFPRRRLAGGAETTTDADDSCALLMRFASGPVAVVGGSAVSAHKTPYRFEAWGSAGTVGYIVEATGPEGFVASTGGQKQPLALSPRKLKSGATPVSGSPVRRQIEATALMLEDWLPGLRGQPTSGPTLTDGYRVQQVVDAARMSSAGGGWVVIED